jgi:hypothetical protein
LLRVIAGSPGVHNSDESGHRIGLRVLLSIALIIIALGVLVMSGPWSELRETTGHAASAKTDTR